MTYSLAVDGWSFLKNMTPWLFRIRNVPRGFPGSISCLSASRRSIDIHQLQSKLSSQESLGSLLANISEYFDKRSVTTHEVFHNMVGPFIGIRSYYGIAFGRAIEFVRFYLLTYLLSSWGFNSHMPGELDTKWLHVIIHRRKCDFWNCTFSSSISCLYITYVADDQRPNIFHDILSLSLRLITNNCN